MEKQKLFNKQMQVMDLFLDLCISIDSISDSDTDKLMALFVNKLAKMFKVHKVSFMMIDETKGELSIKASHPGIKYRVRPN